MAEEAIQEGQTQAAEETPPPSPENAEQGLMDGGTAEAPPPELSPEETTVSHKAEEPEERPDYLLDKYKTVEDQAKGYKELFSSVSQGKHKVPENYDVSIADKHSIEADDPTLSAFVEVAKDAGLSQDQFDQIITKIGGMEGVGGEEQVVMDRQAEMDALGPNAQEMIDDQVGWARRLVESGYWGPDDFEELKFFAGTANGIRAVQKMRRFYGDINTIPTKTTPDAEARPSRQELYELVGTDEYKNSPAERARVERLFKSEFGNKPDHRIVG